MDLFYKIYEKICRPKIYKGKRRCRHKGCDTILNIYDGNYFCLIHRFEHLERGENISRRGYRILTKKIFTNNHRKRISRAMKKAWNKIRRKNAV